MTGKRAQKGDESNMLLVSKVEAEEKIKKQIEEGEELLDLEITSEQDFEGLKRKEIMWDDYNTRLLRHVFSSDEMSKEYSGFRAMSFSGDSTIKNRTRHVHKYIDKLLTRLKSTERCLEFYSGPEEGGNGPIPSCENEMPKIGKDIFIVHGTDDSAKDTVARYIVKLDLNPIILNEKPNKGRTIIEKFEDYSNVGFAVVLLTPDDRGASKSTPTNDLKSRARQNVILELGYFFGKLGRNRVCAFYSKGIELPSDILGVVYIPFDKNGNEWKLKLAAEIKAVGIEVDLNSTI